MIDKRSKHIEVGHDLLFTFFLPTTDNSGNAIESRKLEMAKEQFLTHFEGLTESAPGTGYYVKGQSRQLFVDEVVTISIIASKSPESISQICRIVQDIGLELDQHTMLVTIQPVATVLLNIEQERPEHRKLNLGEVTTS